MKSDKEKFRNFLRDRGLKFTREREAIVDEVLSRKGHFDLEELHMSMKKDGSGVSRASIYRTLPLLLESGVLEEVERTDKHAHYEHTPPREHHDHMLCVSCGKVIEFYSGALERLQDRLCHERQFDGISHTLEIKGYCRRCSGRKG
ncbi:MAG: transcriptional repressor [Thermodesulfovibrionales bacterium]